MLDWLRLLVMIFYAPERGLREVRDRASLAPACLLALLAQILFFGILTTLFLPVFSPRHTLTLLLLLFQSAGSLVFLAIVFVPASVFLVNLIERRGSYRLVMQQEYSAIASTIFYGWTAACLIGTLLTVAGRLSGVLPKLGSNVFQSYMQQRDQMLFSFQPPDPGLLNPSLFAAGIALMVMILIFGVWATAAFRVVFRLTWMRALATVLISGIVLVPTFGFVQKFFSIVLGSPFLLIMAFLILRGYLSEIGRSHRARLAFKQNLEAATLNPSDSSAHYNLGLIHQQRGELEAARERFERAVQIDPDEIDAHYQLGRITRQQKRFGDAIGHFEQVVRRDPSHSQSEIWREVGATYLAAEQFEDARTSLERFLEKRESDPQGLYLMGRAHAGLGHRREAASLMEACINAVKTAPAYKYRLEKRWLNEAQQFLRSQV